MNKIKIPTWLRISVLIFSLIIGLNNKIATANDSREFLRLGNSYADKGDFDKAIIQYTKAVEMNDYYSIWAINNRGWLYRYMGKLDKALADINKAIELNSQDPAYCLHRGDIYLDMGNVDKAQADFNLTIKLDPKNSNGHFGLKLIYDLKGDKVNSALELRKAKELNKNLADEFVKGAHKFQIAKREEQMKKCLEYAAELNSNIK